MPRLVAETEEEDEAAEGEAAEGEAAEGDETADQGDEGKKD